MGRTPVCDHCLSADCEWRQEPFFVATNWASYPFPEPVDFTFSSEVVLPLRKRIPQGHAAEPHCAGPVRCFSITGTSVQMTRDHGRASRLHDARERRRYEGIARNIRRALKAAQGPLLNAQGPFVDDESVLSYDVLRAGHKPGTIVAALTALSEASKDVALFFKKGLVRGRGARPILRDRNFSKWSR